MKWGKKHWYEKMVRKWGVGGGRLAGTEVCSGEWYEKGGIGTKKGVLVHFYLENVPMQSPATARVCGMKMGQIYNVI